MSTNENYVFDEWYGTPDGRDLNWYSDGHTVTLTLYDVKDGCTVTSSGRTLLQEVVPQK
jgi:hypothetical protein